MKSLQLLAVLCLLLPGASLFADQIVLKNGDKLSGTITKSDDKTLLIKTDFAGDVTVQWPAIQEVTSTQPLHVAVQGRKTLAGPVTTAADGNLVVATAAGAAVNVAKADVTAMRNDAQETAFEKGLHPSLMQGWAGGINVGFALTGGNSETENLDLAFNADRSTKTDDIKLYSTSVYSRNNAPGASPSVTANTIQAGARYAHNLTPRLFGFGAVDFQTDELQTLDLRSVFTGGLGFHAIKTAKTTLDFLGGAGYTHETYDAYSDSFAVLSIGEELTQKLGKATALTESAYYYPDMSDTGQYRTTFNTGTITKLSKWLGWQNAFGDIYVTNPPTGKKKNDVIFTTGLNISFLH